jgi:hypothetical protein
MSAKSRAQAKALAAEQAAASARQRQEAEDRRAEEDRQKANNEQKARQTYNTPDSFYGMSDSFNVSAKSWLDSNKDNPNVGAAGADLAYNALKSTAQRESDVNYAKAMTPLALDYQRGAQGIASDAEDRRIASQNVADLKTGEQTAATQRYSYDQARATNQDTNQSEERRLRLAGDETLRLRADARGAIRDVGSRSFGRSGGRRFYG